MSAIRSASGHSATVFLLVLFVSLLPTQLSAQSPGYDIDSVSRAAVQVRVDNGMGSGTLVIVEGIPTVFTNRHVVEGFNEATIAVLTDVNAPAEPKFIARLIGFSDTYDFAVYTITSDLQGNIVRASDLRSGRFGITVPDIQVHDISNKDSDVRRGDQVGIFGYPGIGDDELVYTTGIISSVQVGEYDGQRLPMWYRTNAEMSPGNSGGMALNARGEFIGIPTSVRTEYETGGRLGSLLAVPFVMAILNDDDGLVASWSDANNTFGADQLDVAGEPGFGAVTLSHDELLEPYISELISGGSVDVSYLGDSCVGYAASNPDFRVNMTDSGSELAFFFMADDEVSDTTLVINAPDGQWYCNDDASGDSFDPGLTFTAADSGQYDVWVGSYSSDESVSGTLSIVDTSRFGGSLTTETGSTSTLDMTLDPYFGSADLAAGFTPDPHTITVSAGGSVDVTSGSYGSECRGYASAAPDFKLNWSGDSSRLQIYFVADDGSDATLIVNSSNGDWLCNDDAPGTLNPGITINSPGTGRYDIWVGAYSQGEFIDGELRITEISTDVP
ncbi:MAG: serine protease [Gammaproteobacteria bacterium]|nr:serine protease [Gammaproteobacteria bacterium]